MAVTVLSYADKFVHSLATRDFVALGDAFASEVQFRALVPPGLREARSHSDARNYYQQWFSDKFDLVCSGFLPRRGYSSSTAHHESGAQPYHLLVPDQVHVASRKI